MFTPVLREFAVVVVVVVIVLVVLVVIVLAVVLIVLVLVVVVVVIVVKFIVAALLTLSNFATITKFSQFHCCSSPYLLKFCNNNKIFAISFLQLSLPFDSRSSNIN